VLTALGMQTCSDVLQHMHALYHVCTPIQAQFLLRSCLGVDSNEHLPWDGPSNLPTNVVTRKSIGCERTFQRMFIHTTAHVSSGDVLERFNAQVRRSQLLCNPVQRHAVSQSLFGA
jgi:hypothetical protein